MPEFATFEQLSKKPPKEATIVLELPDDADDAAVGATKEVRVQMRAISSKAYDRLISEHPPTTAEKKDGAVYHVDTFAPALIAACSLQPKMTVEQATAIYTSDEWSSGELASLFIGALKLCNIGVDVPFNEAG